MMTPAQSRAARGIAFMTRWQLAEAAKVPRSAIIDFELNSLPSKPAHLEGGLALGYCGRPSMA